MFFLCLPQDKFKQHQQFHFWFISNLKKVVKTCYKAMKACLVWVEGISLLSAVWLADGLFLNLLSSVWLADGYCGRVLPVFGICYTRVSSDLIQKYALRLLELVLHQTISSAKRHGRPFSSVSTWFGKLKNKQTTHFYETRNSLDFVKHSPCHSYIHP